MAYSVAALSGGLLVGLVSARGAFATAAVCGVVAALLATQIARRVGPVVEDAR